MVQDVDMALRAIGGEQESDDEYARWTSTSSLPQAEEGPAAAIARLAKRPRYANLDEDEDELDEGERDTRGAQRRNFNAQNSRSNAAQQGRGGAEEVEKNEALSHANVGHQLLLKLGWAGTGTGLGMYSQGRADPLSLSFAKLGADTSGIGKLRSTTSALEDALALSRLHELTSEKLATESDSQRSARENDVRKRDEVRAEVLASLSVFRCEVCDGKQYANAAQFAEHTNSYAHHHRKRLRELAANQRALLAGSSSSAGSGAGSSERRREKERKREEREMKALAHAAGVKLGPDPPVPSASTSSSSRKKISSSSGGFQKIGAKAAFSVRAPTPPPPPPLPEHTFAQPPPPPSAVPSPQPPPPPPPPIPQAAPPPPPPPPPDDQYRPPPPPPPPTSSLPPPPPPPPPPSEVPLPPPPPPPPPPPAPPKHPQPPRKQRKPFPIFRSAGFSDDGISSPSV
ncbi:hypothetical protein CF327_g1071 [Tilletia walkeri]|uniref:G-patch domain-containing protein n=1 Tax=Tilletia walkeri TaxID=117179 RepID=A0A8X7T1A0_9BASI|nr:hypothetical protein CF327_g1071 [Tilletia walkeri]KAE8262200.1 hypothetical protein A4X09_0g7514 [Tilletia walkeri]